ncbi:MAG: T9SS C-terminal target domain-containing protein, partial [Calditrichaeota bacterium]
FAYGYLCEPHHKPYTPNSRPTVLLNLPKGLEVPLDGTINLSVQASPDVERVEYYYQWHFLGESIDRDNQFAFTWNLNNYRLKRGNLTITVKAFDADGQVTRPDDGVSSTIRLVAAAAVDDAEGRIPQEFRLGQNYPNPFNPITRIDYDLPVHSQVDLDVYDLSGRCVAALVDSPHAPGQYTVAWDAVEVPSGVYFYRLSTESFTHGIKCVLLK